MPRIADFGLMSIMKDMDAADTQTSVGGIGTPRWSAPELLDPPAFGFKSCRPSKESDCYSFGMTIYEVRCTITSRNRLAALMIHRYSPGTCRFTPQVGRMQ